MGAMLVGLLIPAAAQTDVTSLYVKNPGFESPNDVTTTGNGTVDSWNRSTTEGYNWSGCNGDWKTEGARSFGIWKPAIESDFEFWQDLTLPNGTYTVTVQMTVGMAGATSRVNGQRLFAGDQEDYYPLEAETPNDNGAPYMLSVTTDVTNGTLKIGIRTDGGEASGIGWFKVDDFRLYGYTSDKDMIVLFEKILSGLSEDMEELTAELPGGEATALLAARDAIMASLAGSEVLADYQTAKADFDKLIEDAQVIAVKYQELFTVLNETFDELKALGYDGLPALDAALGDAIAVTESETSMLADVEKALVDFAAATIEYKKSGFPKATMDAPIDASFLVLNPNMDDKTENWTMSNFGWIDTGAKYPPFAGNFLEKWIGQPASLADCSAYQLITGLTNGIYKFEADAMATQQGDASLVITGAMLFANTATLEVSTAAGVPEPKEVYGVVTDGTLKIGMKTVSTNGNWVAFDNVTLAYCGKTDLATYTEAYNATLVYAQALTENEFLPKDKKAIDAAVAAFQSAPHATIAEIETALIAIQPAIETAEALSKSFKAFKAGPQAKAIVISANEDVIYTEEIQNIMTAVLDEQALVLASDTTSIAVFPVLNAELNNYLGFVTAYQSCETYATTLVDGDLIEIVQQVLSFAVQGVAESVDGIAAGKQAFKNIMSFCESYMIGYEYATEAEDTDIFTVLSTQLALVQGDPSTALQAETAIMLAVAEKKYEGTVFGDDEDITWVIANPGFEAEEDETTTGNGTVSGWNRSTTEGYNWSGCNGDWKTEGARSFGIWKNAIESDFEFWQTLALPNGVYTLTADMTVSKSGSTSRVNGQRLFAGDKETYYPAEAETAADNGLAYEMVVNTEIMNGKLKIGVRTNGGTTAGIGWFKVDNFKLIHVSGPTGIEYVDSDAVDALIAYAVNGYIVVPGVEKFAVTTIDGVEVSAASQLIPGTYIVKADGKVAKVFVQ